MSLTLIERIKTMTGDSIKFRHDGSIYPWRGRSGTVIPTWACSHILTNEGWSKLGFNRRSGLWEGVTPSGEQVTFSVASMREFTVLAVYNNERNRQKLVDTCQPV